MNLPVHTRRFRPPDLPALIALFTDTVRRVNSRDYEPDQIRAWAPDLVDLPRWATLADRFTVVAEAEDAVVGFADLEADGHLDRFYVHADYQGVGVGTALMRAVADEAGRLGLARLFAEVSITARPFFERCGFVVRNQQAVVVRGVALTNFRMERWLGPGRAPGRPVTIDGL